LNFWSGKVSTLKRDLDHYQSFAEKLQQDNAKLQADVDNLNRLLTLKEKDLTLAQKQAAGLQDDNERMNRMYQLV
jgi:phage terminase Nu1 subunit (DNA packaging protein)